MYIVRNKSEIEVSQPGNIKIMESGDSVLCDLKGDRQPISIHEIEKSFTTHSFKLYPEDTIYLFSDGYQDQIGGPQGKKFMTKKFKELILSIQGSDLHKQKNILDDTLSKWQGKNNQVDDIIVFGIKWK